MKRKLMLLMTCLMIGIGLVNAQISKVTGNVTSEEDGLPVVGASVLVKGTTVGTVTDIDGNFTLTNVPSSAGTLVISFIGMQSQEVKIKPNVKVVLHSDSEQLDEVMVVAYGTAKKSSFTGSASNIDSKKLELRPITNVSKGLEGQTTGLLTTSGSGQPGEASKIIIRGYGSINASQDPLYVVDGIPFDGDLSSINPSDIESMTVLKDASAGALYGARGANGVVMITTKQGKEGKTKVSWRSTVGWSSRALKEYDMVDQKDFIQLTYEGLRNDYVFNSGYDWQTASMAAIQDLGPTLGGNKNAELYNPFKNYTWDTIIDPTTGKVREDAVSAWNEPWMDAVQKKNAFRHEHQLSINGGTEKTKYMFSLGYLDEDGILVGTGFQRYNARANVSSQVNDWFKAGLNTSLSTSQQNFSDYDGPSYSNVWYSAQFMAPIYPMYVKDADGNNLLDSNGNPQLDYGEGGRPQYSDYNPLGGLLDDKADIKNDVAGVRTFLAFGSDKEDAGWAQGLKLTLNFGADYRNQSRKMYMNMHHGNQAKAGGLLYKYNTRTLSYTFNQLLTWNRSFGLHNVDVMAGHEFYSYEYSYLEAAKSNLVDGILELRPGTTLQSADSYTNQYRVESWLGRINYNFDEKYYLSASLRSDGSSRFHKDHRWGTFWSIGGNWRVSKEAFMSEVEWVDNLSVKLSYGQQGNDNILNSDGTVNYYAWQSLYPFDLPNGTNVGAIISSLENRDITWEKSGNLNVGIEASLFNNRLRINAEYYNKKTTDMLLSYPMATSTGFSGYNANVGDMRNSGFEFEVSGTLIQHNDFKWDLTFMGSTVKNEVLSLTKESPEIISGIYSIKEGMPINTFYMVKSAGVDPATGAELFWTYDKDENGNITKEYVTSNYNKANTTKYYLGSRIPDLYGSVGTNLSWKGIDLSVLTTYSIGGKIFDGLYEASMNIMYPGNTWNEHALRRWQNPGDITDVPRIEIGGTNRTDRFLINASYFAIKNITLGYNLPQNWIRKAGLGSVRIFASCDNLALFSHLNGMDPQYSFNGSTDYSYAPNKTYSFGLEVNF